MLLVRRSLIAVLLLCLGCAAQSSAPEAATAELNQRIERQVRAFYSIPPGVQISVGPRKPSEEFPGYDSVTVFFVQTDRKQSYDFLISKDNKSLVRLTKLDVTKDPYAEIMRKINVQGRPVRGNKDAKVSIINYDDFECPFCSRMHATLMQEILKPYGDRVKIIYKDYPLFEIHPWAIHAAVDANCLAAQNNDAYWDFADYVHGHQFELKVDERHALPDQMAALDRITLQIGQRRNLTQAPLEACVKAQSDAAVQESLKEANGLGVSATPTMFVNGEKLDGAFPAVDVRAMIDRALHDAGQPGLAPPAAPPVAAPAATQTAPKTPAPPAK